MVPWTVANAVAAKVRRRGAYIRLRSRWLASAPSRTVVAAGVRPQRALTAAPHTAHVNHAGPAVTRCASHVRSAMSRCATRVAALGLLLAALAVARAAVPGFRTQVTQKGLDYLRDVAVVRLAARRRAPRRWPTERSRRQPILVQQLRGISIPDVSGKAGTPIGGISYKLSQIKLGQLSIPHSTLAITPGVGLSVGAGGVSVQANAHWSYREDVRMGWRSGACTHAADGAGGRRGGGRRSRGRTFRTAARRRCPCRT